MINIWKYANSLPRIKLLDTHGEQYIGQVIAVFDAEELDSDQDCIDIRLDSGGIISFYPDEIERIDVIR